MQNVKNISNKLWKAMQDEDVATLEKYIHPQAVFVHMGVTLSKEEEIDVIKNQKIVYKNVAFDTYSTHEVGAVTILLNKIVLTAVVNGNEVVNPFVVTEVYTKDTDDVQLASLSYTRINY